MTVSFTQCSTWYPPQVCHHLSTNVPNPLLPVSFFPFARLSSLGWLLQCKSCRFSPKMPLLVTFYGDRVVRQNIGEREEVWNFVGLPSCVHYSLSCIKKFQIYLNAGIRVLLVIDKVGLDFMLFWFLSTNDRITSFDHILLYYISITNCKTLSSSFVWLL